ncbi:MAG: hypothetical protein AVDCRST_MAG80-2397, partial [uncultured Rubrobacteraceae bacterium]
AKEREGDQGRAAGSSVVSYALYYGVRRIQRPTVRFQCHDPRRGGVRTGTEAGRGRRALLHGRLL